MTHELDALDDALEDADLAPDDRAAFRAHHYHALVHWYQTQRAAVARWMTTWDDPHGLSGGPDNRPVRDPWLTAYDEFTIH